MLSYDYLQAHIETITDALGELSFLSVSSIWYITLISQLNDSKSMLYQETEHFYYLDSDGNNVIMCLTGFDGNDLDNGF